VLSVRTRNLAEDEAILLLVAELAARW